MGIRRCLNCERKPALKLVEVTFRLKGVTRWVRPQLCAYCVETYVAYLETVVPSRLALPVQGALVSAVMA